MRKLQAAYEEISATEEVLRAQLEENRNAQSMILKSEEQWSDLFIQNQSAIAVYQAIDDGNDFTIENFNPAAESIEKVKRDAIIGKRVTRSFRELKSLASLAVFRRYGRPENLNIWMFHFTRMIELKDGGRTRCTGFPLVRLLQFIPTLQSANVLKGH